MSRIFPIIPPIFVVVADGILFNTNCTAGSTASREEKKANTHVGILIPKTVVELGATTSLTETLVTLVVSDDLITKESVFPFKVVTLTVSLGGEDAWLKIVVDNSSIPISRRP